MALLARRISRLKVLAADIQKNGGRATAIRCDVTQDSDIEKAVAVVHKRLGITRAVFMPPVWEVRSQKLRVAAPDSLGGQSKRQDSCRKTERQQQCNRDVYMP